MNFVENIMKIGENDQFGKCFPLLRRRNDFPGNHVILKRNFLLWINFYLNKPRKSRISGISAFVNTKTFRKTNSVLDKGQVAKLGRGHFLSLGVKREDSMRKKKKRLWKRMAKDTSRLETITDSYRSTKLFHSAGHGLYTSLNPL